ncbi:MAG: helix-turn-helix domain-containing protein [Chloroflexi bacterium]|nr:MAG: helix-turn-helix domain-containing protein [Chloroflexota bacterium]
MIVPACGHGMSDRLRPAQVADMLSVSRSQVYRMVRRGEWPAGRDRRGMWVSHAGLQAWLDDNVRANSVRGWWAPGRPVRVLTGGRAG